MHAIKNVAEAWATAWMNSDTEAFVALFAADVLYRDDQAGRVSRNHEDLRSFHRHFAQALSDVRLEFTNIFSDGTNACMEWMSSGVQTGTYHGRPPTNRRFRVPGVSVVKVTPSGLISHCVDYYNGLLLARQLDGTHPV